MARYYHNDYWALSEKERLWRARDNYQKWKRIVRRSRTRLTSPEVVKVVVDAGYRFVDVWGNVTKTGPIVHSMGQPMDVLRRQYLADYKRYLIALLEYKRLKANSESNDPHRRPTTVPRQAPHDTPRGPIGVSQSPGRPVTEPEIMREMKKELLTRLRKSTERARKLKSDEAVADMLGDAAEAQKLGLEGDADVALQAAGWVADENLSESMSHTATERSPKALRNLLNDVANAQFLGADDQVEAAMELAVDVVAEIETKAEFWFRKKPTKQRFRHWLYWQSGAQSLGQESKDWLEGVAHRRPAGKYKIKPGDTLSKIARTYYGDPSRWDVIYLYNYGVIGADPDLILPHVTLEIP